MKTLKVAVAAPLMRMLGNHAVNNHRSVTKEIQARLLISLTAEQRKAVMEEILLGDDR